MVPLVPITAQLVPVAAHWWLSDLLVTDGSYGSYSSNGSYSCLVVDVRPLIYRWFPEVDARPLSYRWFLWFV